MCLSNIFILPNILLQLRHGSFFSCTPKMCLFKSLFVEKLELQIWHWNGFFFSWTAAMCWSRWLLVWIPSPHIEHWKGFFPSWTESICFFKAFLVLKLASHFEQICGFFSLLLETVLMSMFCSSLSNISCERGSFVSYNSSLIGPMFEEFSKYEFQVASPNQWRI